MPSCPNHGTPPPNLGWRAIDVLVEQFGRWPMKAAADAIGVQPDTWKAWKERRQKPNTDMLSALFKRFGPTFISHVTAPFEESYLDLKQARIDAQIAQLLHEKSALETDRSRVRPLAAKPTVEAAAVVAKRGGENEA